PSLGDNVNGPSIVRAPAWIKQPLGRYYAYFPHHKGRHIRLAYADAIAGPWNVYEPGVLRVEETAFMRPPPDPPNDSAFYTHVASLLRGRTLYVFFSGIGDAPERILLSTIDLIGDWQTWKASTPIEMLRPDMPYECAHLPIAPSATGEIEGPARQLRDPAVFE